MGSPNYEILEWKARIKKVRNDEGITLNITVCHVLPSCWPMATNLSSKLKPVLSVLKPEIQIPRNNECNKKSPRLSGIASSSNPRIGLIVLVFRYGGETSLSCIWYRFRCRVVRRPWASSRRQPNGLWWQVAALSPVPGFTTWWQNHMTFGLWTFCLSMPSPKHVNGSWHYSCKRCQP